MTMNVKKVVASLFALSVISMSMLCSAQYATDQGDTKLTIVSEWWELVVSTFDIDFGTVTSSANDRLATGTIVGNQWYIVTKDTLASKVRYVTIDATNIVWSGASWTGVKVIKDSKLTMTSIWGAAAITVLSWNATPEVVGVTQTAVNFSGSAGYTIMERTSVTSGILGKYGIIPTFKLTIPGYTPVGAYLGTIEVSLYTP